MPAKRGKSEVEDSDSILREIRDYMKTMNERISKIEEKVSGIEDSLNYHSDVVEELKSDVSTIKSVLPSIQQKVERHDHLSLNKSIEIQGIPHQSDESLVDIVLSVAQKQNVKIDSNNIDVAYRNRSKKSINVRFIQTHVRDNLLRAIKSNDSTPLTAKDLGYKTPDRVFVNELLSFEVRQLFYKVRLLRNLKI